MVIGRGTIVREPDHDEGELNSEEDSRESSSEGFTTDGEDSNEDDRSDKRKSPEEETPWERGLRIAREHARKAKLLRQSDADLEDKKLNFTVVAPDPNEDAAYADVCDIGRSSLVDTFWFNYHRLSIVGSTQLTCKRSLPCDLSPPSRRTMARWRRRFSSARARSSDGSRASTSSSSTASSTVTSDYGSCASSLSSLAGSILFAVPDLVLADDSDREKQRRRRHRSNGGRSGTSSRSCESSSDSSSGTGSRSGRRVSSSRSTSRSSSKGNQENQQRKKNRDVFSASSSTSTASPAAPAAYSKNRSRLSGKDGRIISPRSREEEQAWRNRRPPLVPYGDQHRPPPPALPQISGYHHQQNSFNKSAFRNEDNGSGYSNRHGYGETSRWHDSANSPDRPPPMPSERPVKRPWVAEPPKSRGSQARQRSPPLQQLQLRSKSRRSRSRSVSRDSSLHDGVVAGGASTTYVTSWSQLRARQHITKPTLPDVVPSQTISSPPRKRAASSRRKSRSPFADSYFGNPPAPAEVPFEQSVPLLAGAVNPAAPTNTTASTKALPSASTRPGVKLKIAPRVRGGLVLPGSALERAHRNNDFKVNGSPVSSASSRDASGGDGQNRCGHSDRRGSRSSVRRDKNNIPSPSSAKRMRHLGYTAVSPGGFESPPPPPSSPPTSAVPARSYSRPRRLDAEESTNRVRNRVSDQARSDGRRSRAGGDYHDRTDRFSRSGHPHQPPERYRERRPPQPLSSERFDRRGVPDRYIQPYDRVRPSRDYFGDSHYGRSRGEERDNRSYVTSGRHGVGNRRQGNAARSRSPFEGRTGGGGGDSFHNDSATEQRLNELRRRLTMVDDKIAELGGAPVADRR